MAEIICSNFNSHILHTPSRKIEEKSLQPKNFPISTLLTNLELLELNNDIKMEKIRSQIDHTTKTLVKAAAGILIMFIEIQKEKFKRMVQMVADIAAIAGKRCEIIRSCLKPEFRSLCSRNVDPTELLF